MKIVHVVLMLLVVVMTAPSTAQSQKTAQPIVIVGARLIDGTGAAAVESATLVINNGRIQDVGPSAKINVPAGAERVDAVGKTIVPGLINAHGHVGDTRGLETGAQFYTDENIRRQLRLYGEYGVTTVFSLGGDRDQGFAIRDLGRNDPQGARLFIAGPVITAKTPDEARTMVNSVADRKPDIIKIRVDDNLGETTKMPPDVYRAVIDAAHARGLRVAAHVYYQEDAKSLLKSGVDFIAHSIRDRDVDAETISLFKQRDVCLCPTLTREISTFVYETRPTFFDDPFFLRAADRKVLDELVRPERQERVRTSRSAQAYKTALKVASRNLKKLVDAGVKVAMGTDTGPPARFQGYFEHLELELMADAGLTPRQVLVAATGDAARCMKVAGQLGTLEPGAWADFLVLSANPLDNVRNSRTIESAWIAGRRLSLPSSSQQ